MGHCLSDGSENNSEEMKGELRYIGVLQQRAGSQGVGNIKRLLLIKETRFVKLRNLALLLYGQMQESGRTDINPLMCTTAIWDQFPVFSHPECPQGSQWEVTAV